MVVVLAMAMLMVAVGFSCLKLELCSQGNKTRAFSVLGVEGAGGGRGVGGGATVGGGKNSLGGVRVKAGFAD